MVQKTRVDSFQIISGGAKICQLDSFKVRGISSQFIIINKSKFPR